MSNRFLTRDIWTRISELSRKKGPRHVAVPFLGKGATRRLHLQSGDVLIIRFNKATLKAGMVDPHEVMAYLKKGVRVFNVDNLHAKVFVLGRRAVVGSANVSQSSEGTLLEAGIETSEPSMVAATRTFVLGLKSEPLETEYVRALTRFYHPPKSQPGKNPPQGARTAPLWAVSLTERCTWNRDDKKYSKIAVEAAKKKAKTENCFIDRFCWEGRGMVPKVTIGHRLIMMTETMSRRVVLSPPGRVVQIRPYRSEGEQRYIICLARPKGSRKIHMKRVRQKLGSDAAWFSKLEGVKLVRNQRLSFRFGRLWAK
jgi:hypothetical protein